MSYRIPKIIVTSADDCMMQYNQAKLDYETSLSQYQARINAAVQQYSSGQSRSEMAQQFDKRAYNSVEYFKEIMEELRKIGTKRYNLTLESIAILLTIGTAIYTFLNLSKSGNSSGDQQA